MTTKVPKLSWVAWAVALVWSAGLFAFALAPTYATVRSGPHGAIRSTESLVSENGTWVIVVLGVPFAVTVLVGLTFLLSRHRAAFSAAWALTILLVVFNALALLTLGILFVPTTAALITACSVWGMRGGVR